MSLNVADLNSCPGLLHSGPQSGGAHWFMGKHVTLSQRPQCAGAGPSWRDGDGDPDCPHRERHPRVSILRRSGQIGSLSFSEIKRLTETVDLKLCFDGGNFTTGSIIQPLTLITCKVFWSQHVSKQLTPYTLSRHSRFFKPLRDLS